jgi:phospholipid transport system transporter-binding protein
MNVQLPPLPATLTHAAAQACVDGAASKLQALGAGSLAEIDAGSLQQFDSSALAVLLAIRRLAMARGAELRVQGLPPRLRELSVLYGVSELLPG